MHTDKVLIL